ncbi:hypothetical protein CISG_02447 [Coccidioides immitis RMSCC 3703]|uniref:DNA repair protein Rad26 n=1 Tax=Coccidioides immitis RMSCC 3703 TaxID=454286 RepID=A0A0J8RB01_COCIT|nr:hypothetical protein CISG_02447 [Coccidioides immitis RMSCC 3703]
MEDDDLYYDELVDGISADELLALVDNADAAASQHQLAASAPRQQPITPPQHALYQYNSGAQTSHGEPSVLRPPSKLLRNPISFGDTDTQNLDAGVLDDGGGPSPVEEHHAGLQNAPDRAEDVCHAGVEAIAAPKGRTEALRKRLPRGEDTDAGSEMMLVPDESKHGIDVDDQTMDVDDMMDQIRRLTMEREQLFQELASVKTEAEKRAGEIAIIRANHIKAEQNHSRQISALQNALDEELKKHQAQIDAAMTESKRMATENQFLKQDLREETLRLNEIQQNRKAVAKADDAAPTTPRKTRMLPLRDGFDDDEIMASPSRSAGRRSKRGTPSAAGKRKRAVADDSPITAPLQLSQSFESNLMEAAQMDPVDLDARLVKPPKEDYNIKVVRKILNHKSYPCKVRDLEAFASISFPKEPERMFSSYILQATTTKPSENFAVEYAKAVISLWARSLRESFYDPIFMFMSIIKFILNLDTTAIAPLLVIDLLPVLHNSVYVNGVPRFTNSPVSHQSYGQIKQTPQKDLDHRVNATEALEILYLTVSGCCHDHDALRLFWQSVDYDFILIMLNPYQPIRDIITVLNILSCSILPTSFGPILKTEADQLTNQKYIIDRLANLLHEKPAVDEGEKPYTPWEVASLRMEAMSFLLEVAFSCPSPDPQRNQAGRILATHPSALARVFRAMHDELDALYSYPPERELHAALVNGLTRLAYGILTMFPGEVDLSPKLRAVPGAVQKHLVVLTRLAFSEGPLLESGITDDTVEMAHEMLEDAVNPQEAEALLEAFRSSKAGE